MSKQKEPETENEVTENPIEQQELEGISTEKEPEKETDAKTDVETEVKPVVEKTSKSTKLSPMINTVATASVKSNKKMGVYKFLSLYSQDIYIETLLIYYYPHSFFVVDEWIERIQEILGTPINN